MPDQSPKGKGAHWIRLGLITDFSTGKVHFVQADKRAVLLFPERQKAGFACAEASPDVRAGVERVAKALSEAEGKVPKDGDLKIAQQLEAVQKITMESLLARTQGLQVLRDMLFQACLANVRGDMSGVQYVAFVSTTLPRLTTSLIAAELVMKADNRGSLSGPDLQTFLNFLILNSQ